MEDKIREGISTLRKINTLLFSRETQYYEESVLPSVTVVAMFSVMKIPGGLVTLTGDCLLT